MSDLNSLPVGQRDTGEKQIQLALLLVSFILSAVPNHHFLLDVEIF